MKNKIIIKEIDKGQVKQLSKALLDFNPVKCYLCGNKKKIKQRFFLLNAPALEKFDKKIKKELRNKFGLTYYAFSEENMKVITTAKCLECDNEKMYWDY